MMSRQINKTSIPGNMFLYIQNNGFLLPSINDKQSPMPYITFIYLVNKYILVMYTTSIGVIGWLK